MYYLCKLTYGNKVAYTVTNHLPIIESQTHAGGGKVETLWQSYDWESILKAVRALYGIPTEKYPIKQNLMLIKGQAYMDFYDTMYTLEDIGPRALGWRIRRLGYRFAAIRCYLHHWHCAKHPVHC